MLAFSTGLTYLRDEALKAGFIQDSDNDDKLVERLSQVVRQLGPEDAKKADALTAKNRDGAKEKEKEDEPSSDKGTKGKA